MLKKLIVALCCTIALVLGSGCASKQLKNDWTDSRPGTIFISGNLSDMDFQAFYNQTLDPKIRDYTIILNTNGGESMACTGIISRMTELQAKGIKFTTIVYTKAYSAGAFIYMMGNHRIMHQGATLMWHTMRGEMYFRGKEYPFLPGTIPFAQKEMFEGLDEHVIRLTERALPNVDPMTLETMLRYSGMTFIIAKDANTLGMVDEYVVTN